MSSTDFLINFVLAALAVWRVAHLLVHEDGPKGLRRHVHATRDRLNEELRRIWQETGTTILFVTHSVYEATFLGEQVLVMSANPGRVSEIVSIDLPRNRDLSVRETEPFVRIAAKLRATLGRGTP